jgi:hypothetical protein
MTTLPEPPTFAMLCVMTHHVLDRLGPDAQPSDIVAELKCDVARAGFSYPPPDHFTAVAEAVAYARAKGYRTPTTRRPS